MLRPPRQRTPGEGVVDVAATAEPAVRDLQAFLRHGGLAVYDVAPGAAPGTRRLVVGEARRSRPVYVVALAVDADGPQGIEHETRQLTDLRARLRPRLQSTVPAPVGSIEVGRHRGAVLSVVPGSGRGRGRQGSALVAAGAVLDWLALLWEDTAGRTAPSDLGAAALGVIAERFGGSLAAVPLLRRLEAARAALAEVSLPRTAGHGCLCSRHVRLDGAGDVVLGVDDWGIASLDADPLSDLGAWLVGAVGTDLPAVFADRGTAGAGPRGVLARGLGRLGVGAGLWREVLLLAAAEAAVAGLARQDTHSFHLLGALARQVTPQGDRHEDGVRL